MMRAGGGLLGALVVWAVLWSPLLEVRNIEIQGSPHTSAAEIAGTADVLDENILFVSAAAVAKDAEELPWVASARVDRLLPNTLRVRIVERVPAVVVATESGTWIVDETGHFLQRARGNEALPTMEAAGVSVAEPGERLARPSFLDGVRALASMPRSLAGMVESVSAPTSEGISFTLAGGIVVRYGAAQAMGDKNKVIEALLERFGSASGPTYFDVRVPTNPAVAGAEVPDGVDE